MIKDTIIGGICCPDYATKGYSGNESRANLLFDGRIACISCATVHEPTPASSKRALDRFLTVLDEVLYEATGSRPSVQSGLLNRDKTEPPVAANEHSLAVSPYAAACLCGYDPETFDIVRQLYSGGGLRVSVQYFRSELPNVLRSDLPPSEPLSDQERQLVPGTVQQLIARLDQRLGLRLGGSAGTRLEPLTGGLYPRLGLSAGIKVGQMGYVCGIAVEVSW